MALSIPQMARMSQLLEEALGLDMAARRPWLEKATQEHPDLAAALRESLLPEAADAAELNSLMSLPKLSSAEAASASSANGLAPGTRVGPYELIRLLGAGGMAEVWLARRADGAFRREVALKLPMRNRPQAGLEARFARERDILASLEHPHIARLYDAGVDPQGLPYLAMEYVQGVSLTDWCDTHRLGITQRLGLLLQVLEAVQYAHEKQVVHRDLKPSNILVTQSGQVRLLDFGIARLLEGEATDQPALTSVHGRALTPDYASPELLRGDPIDARSDLYSLGVLLYELLTGTRPYRLRSAASIGALDHAIGMLEVAKPSVQLEQAAPATPSGMTHASARQMRGDLDAIVLKLLAKDPAQRYPSAAALAEDLRAFLAGKPIQAQPARLYYRLGKFVRRNRTLVGVCVTALVAILAAVGYDLYRESRAQVTVSAKALSVPATPIPPPVAAFAPPPHSIAVLPFVTLSGDKDQEYFSDGLTEELLNSLAQIDGLQVAARTSSFSFKEHPDIAAVAHKLNVGAVLEGSVRRSANTIRISAQLINAVTGYHLWSRTYDRELGDVLKLQTEIATAVASALKVTLLGDVAAKVELGGTRNPAAFDAYLRGAKTTRSMRDVKDLLVAVAAYTEATRLDPHYALAFAARSMALSSVAGEAATTEAMREDNDKARADAHRALSLAPDLAQAHIALAHVFEINLDFTQANDEYERALALAPGNVEVLIAGGQFATNMGHFDAGLKAARRAVELDPLSRESHYALAWALLVARHYEEAVAAFAEVIRLDPDSRLAFVNRGFAYYGLGDLERARASCEAKPDDQVNQQCLAIIYDKLGRHADAEAVLAKLKAAAGEAMAYQYATIYAQWSQRAQALQWLETAMRLRDPGLQFLKTDSLLDSLRQEPQFKAIERELKFPP